MLLKTKPLLINITINGKTKISNKISNKLAFLSTFDSHEILAVKSNIMLIYHTLITSNYWPVVASMDLVLTKIAQSGHFGTLFVKNSVSPTWNSVVIVLILIDS